MCTELLALSWAQVRRGRKEHRVVTREERGKGERLQDVRGARLAYMCWVMRAEKMSSARKKKRTEWDEGKKKLG